MKTENYLLKSDFCKFNRYGGGGMPFTDQSYILYSRYSVSSENLIKHNSTYLRALKKLRYHLGIAAIGDDYESL